MQKKRNLETSAGRAAAAADKALARLARRSPRDWRKLAKDLHKAFARLWTSDLVRRDAQARTIMLRMARARDIEDLDCEVDLLALRVADLLARRRGDDQAAVAGVARTGVRRRPADSRSGRFDDEPDAPLLRTFIAL